MSIVRRAILCAAGLAILAPAAALAQSNFRVISWNLRHEGWSGDTNPTGVAQQAWRQYGTSSTSTNGFDAIFLQEVMNSTVANDIATALKAESGVTWAVVQSPLIGRTSYKEIYACVYRTDRVSLVSSYVWNDPSDIFEREPHVVKLRDRNTNADFTFINWHTRWGNGTSDVTAEVQQIHQVFNSVQSSDSTDQDVILLGDHNCSATSSNWSRMTSTSFVSPAATYAVNDLTTINSSGGYANPYDHFWYQSSNVTEVSSFGRDYIANTSTFRTNLSDHAPVWLRLYSTSDTD